MNPSLAVKQYSRSSADQEVPLPHELRPVKVLKMTMTYLMAKIMNLCDTVDVNFAEWYHFLWDRTRGIRKDITQQELCSEEAVELLEQCARFHIHCSARLVAEDPSVFDQKINTENLTKCLQTLKYMYHDLELKGIYCKNEPEFRAYIILLNLNDGNFMWEVQQLRPDVQKSQEVRFAMQVYSALDKSNYVRFFKLVHSTTYLNACILLRYFVQVRLSALSIILKCFSPRQPHKSYPLNELKEILAFETVEATADFLEYHGLMLSEDRMQVVLDRKLFVMPEYPYTIDRAISVIESKRTSSVGEIVAGVPLSINLYENHTPQNSFDDQGRLNITKILTELKINLNKDTEEEVDEADTIETPFLAKLLTTERSRSPMLFDTKSAAAAPPPPVLGMFAAASENIFGKEQEKSIFGNAQPNISEQLKFVISEEVSKPILPVEPRKIELREPPKSEVTIIPEKKLETPETVVEKPPLKFQTVVPVVEAKIPPLLPKPDLSQILKAKLEEEEEEKKRVDELKRKKLFEERERKKREEIETKKLQEIRIAVTSTVYFLLDAVEEKVKTDRIEEIARRFRYRKAEKCLKIWRDTVRVTRRKRKAVDYCFAWLMPRTMKEEAEQLRTNSEGLVLSDMKRYKSGKPMEIIIPTLPIIQKIKIHDICYNNLLGSVSKWTINFPRELFWKVNISLDKINQCVEEILNDCIGWKNKNGTTFLLEQRRTINQNVTYCIEKFDKNNCKTINSNSFIFIAKDLNENLHKCIQSHNITNPIVFILENVPKTQRIKELQMQNCLRTYKIIDGKFTSDNIPRLLEKALTFLAQHVDQPPPLELDTLRSFLTFNFVGDIWKRISGLAKWNSSYRKCLRNPEIAIKIYNDNLDKLKKILFDVERKKYPQFPEIFAECLLSELPDCLPCDYKYFPKFWKSENYEYILRSVLDTFYLSDYVNAWPPENEIILERDLFAYCEKNFRTPEKTFYRIMGMVLKNIDPKNNLDGIKNFLWTDLMETIALEKISENNFSFCNPQSIFNQLFVVYNKETLRKYAACSWYYVSYPPIQSKIKDLMVNNETKNQVKKKVCSDSDLLEFDIDLNELWNKVTKTTIDYHEVNLERCNNIKEIEGLMYDFKECLAVQKKINSTVDESLHLALKNN